MQNEHAGLIRGLGIATVILSGLAILGCLIGLAFVGIGGHAVREIGPSGFEYYYYNGSNMGNAMDDYGISGRTAYGWTQMGLALAAAGLVWEIICGIAALIAGIVAIRYHNVGDKLRLVTVWGIVGAVSTFLCGRIITLVLFIIMAVYAHRDRQTLENPYGYGYGYASYGQPYGQQPYYYGNPQGGTPQGYTPNGQPTQPYGQTAQSYGQPTPSYGQTTQPSGQASQPFHPVNAPVYPEAPQAQASTAPAPQPPTSEFIQGADLSTPNAVATPAAEPQEPEPETSLSETIEEVKGKLAAEEQAASSSLTDAVETFEDVVDEPPVSPSTPEEEAANFTAAVETFESEEEPPNQA